MVKFCEAVLAGGFTRCVSLTPPFPSSRAVDFMNNQIRTLGRIFDEYTASGLCALDFGSNLLTQASLKTAMSSFTHSVSRLYLSLSGNRVTGVPAHLFDGISTNTPSDRLKFVEVSVDLSINPISIIDTSVFSGVTKLSAIALDVSFPTAGDIQTPATNFSFRGIDWAPMTGGALNFSLHGTGVGLSIVGALSAGINSPQSMTLNLRFNNYTTICDYSLATSKATSLDFSFNNITWISEMAFRFGFPCLLPLSSDGDTVALAGTTSQYRAWYYRTTIFLLCQSGLWTPHPVLIRSWLTTTKCGPFRFRTITLRLQSPLQEI